MNDHSIYWKGLSDKSVFNLVRNIRKKANKGDVFCALETPHMAMVKDSGFFYVRFAVN